jgi:hypothetical protein
MIAAATLPSAIVAGISRLGTAALRNSSTATAVERKCDDEQRDATAGQHRAGQHHRQHGAPRAQPVDEAQRDRARRARVLHQLAEQRAQQEQREEQRDEAAGSGHEDLHVARQQRRARRGQHRDRRGQRAQDQHVDAAVREDPQQDQRDEDAQDAQLGGDGRQVPRWLRGTGAAAAGAAAMMPDAS